MVVRRIYIVFFLAILFLETSAQKSFNIRGVLPWHNFLSGPSAWNEDDYRKYLDECQQNGINFIGFHNYTGGGERYATYVEPMIRIAYKNILPVAYFDNSTTSRWGYLPMKVSDFAYGSGSAFHLPAGADAFGNDGSVVAKTPDEHYRHAQTLMAKVLKMAHERGIQMAMGFEFGVLPPEYFSLHESGDCFYWQGESTMIPNPTNQTAIELHQAALDNILESYPDIDWIWLWLNEHSFMSVNVEKALQNKSFRKIFDDNLRFFTEAESDKERFVGVWSLEYIRMTETYLKKKGSKARLILGGWGGGNQLPGLLKGLDRALPKDIVFSCLNPDLGKQPQPLFLSEIAKNRKVWAVPWLEGDHQLWHFQPRVAMLRDQVRLAGQQNLDGVIAIHWRTEETRFNMKAFCHFAVSPEADESVENLYTQYVEAEFGKNAADKLVPLLVKLDREQIYANVPSPEFYAYTPEWGKLDEQNVAIRKQLGQQIDQLVSQSEGTQKAALVRFGAMFRFELLLNEVGRSMMPAWTMKKNQVEAGTKFSHEDFVAARKALESAPVKAMFDTYRLRVNSQGELGVLSSLNQRVWSQYNELKNYLEENLK